MIRADDDLVFDERLPAKLIKALAVITSTMHQTYDAQPWIAHVGKSKASCILSSLTARDFLRAIGFDDAEVKTVCTIMKAERAGQQLHALGIGEPSQEVDDPDSGFYPVHMVTTLRRSRVLIDTTLFQAKRPAWPKLPGIMAVPMYEPSFEAEWGGMPAISGVTLHEPDDDYRCDILWLDRPLNAWRTSGDAKEGWRRKAPVEAMLAAFGDWHE